ncbi:MAG TPA: CAP domain-containing protein [Pseudonocardia sp.]|nr:CAP domain-containing protein [Pseudonocardia sp.]
MSEPSGGRAAARLPFVAALVALACSVPLTAAHAGTGSGDAADAVVALVNEEREAAGCSPVSVDDRLAEAAQEHARDQAEQEQMSHEGSDGSTVGERATRAGYRWSSIGENVAWGTTSAERVMEMWMESSGHRDNILNCRFRHIGVDEVNGYWSQVFGRPR